VSLAATLRFILGHPLNAHSKANAFGRYIGWQIRSRVLPGPVIVPFVNSSKLVVRRGRPSSTGNLYTRLHEFAEMGFVLHALRENDLFVDVGANIGAYSILAASLQGTRCIAFEPASDTYELLVENVLLNDYGSRVTTHRTAIGEEEGELLLTARLDTVNHVVSVADAGAPHESVPVHRLDDLLGEDQPAVIKIDVEGYETPVIKGAEKTLQRETLLALVVEMNGSGDRYGLDEKQLDQTLLDHGFTPLSYDPLARRIVPLPAVNRSGNRIYMRDRAALQERLRAAAPFTLAGGLRI
jgi:FkbM family methyltransferase